MNAEIQNVVNQFLEKYVGGEEFYDALDEQIRIHDIWLYAMIARIEKETSYDRWIVSGKFGRRFYEFVKTNIGEEGAQKILVTSGSLRKGKAIGLEEEDLTGLEFLFIDDSFWSGKTRDVIQRYLEKNHAHLKKTYVFYDGSKKKEETVESFYRYYDYH